MQAVWGLLYVNTYMGLWVMSVHVWSMHECVTLYTVEHIYVWEREGEQAAHILLSTSIKLQYWEDLPDSLAVPGMFAEDKAE